MFERIIKKTLLDQFFKGKIIILTGPRQVGKTTLIQNILTTDYSHKKVATYFGEHLAAQDLLSAGDFMRLTQALDGVDIIFIDEGQKIPHIGNTLKILVDHYKNSKQIIVTGSSSFHLLDQVSESLAGRKRVSMLYPISYEEFQNAHGAHMIPSQIESWLLYGMYPAVLQHATAAEKIEELTDLTSSSLYRDILELQEIKNPAMLTKLLKILALQIGQEVSLHALGQMLALESRTVERYIDLLEKSYIIYRIPPYFTNKHKEIIKTQKIYFFDVGMRNALLGNFQPLDVRDDVGKLWENWVFSEWIKHRKNHKKLSSFHFWRGRNQQEIDLIEDNAGVLQAFEIKWGTKKSSLPSGFREIYGDIPYHTVSRELIGKWLSR